MKDYIYTKLNASKIIKLARTRTEIKTINGSLFENLKNKLNNYAVIDTTNGTIFIDSKFEQYSCTEMKALVSFEEFYSFYKNFKANEEIEEKRRNEYLFWKEFERIENISKSYRRNQKKKK